MTGHRPQPRRRRWLLLATPATALQTGVMLAGAAAPAAAAPPAPTPTATAAPSTPSAPAAASRKRAPDGSVPVPTPIQVGPPELSGPSAPPAGSGGTVDGGGDSSPGLFDITGHITAAIDAWFRDLVTSALTRC